MLKFFAQKTTEDIGTKLDMERLQSLDNKEIAGTIASGAKLLIGTLWAVIASIIANIIFHLSEVAESSAEGKTNTFFGEVRCF